MNCFRSLFRWVFLAGCLSVIGFLPPLARADGQQYESPEIKQAIEYLRKQGATVNFYSTTLGRIGDPFRIKQEVTYYINIHSMVPNPENLAALLVVPKVDRLSVGPNFKRDQLAWNTLAQLSEITTLSISGDLQEYDLPNIARFSNLKTLTLQQANNLNPEDLWYLEELTSLKRVSLSLDEDGAPYFDYLARVPHLEDVSLSLSRDKPVSLAGIQKLEHLVSLSIDAQDVPGTDLQEVGQLSQLTSLNLLRTFLRPEEMEIFRGLNKVTYLNLYRCHFKDNPVDAFEGMTSLERIQLSSNDMTDAVFLPLSKLPKIRYMYVRGSKITDEGLAHLHKAKSLRMIQLSSTDITQAGVDALAKALPTLQVIAPLNKQ
ncbi:hypothetical protein DTL42_22095 [Bremerella cremea]|uniref:Leucine Rich repeats (2 copies) n=1 Tax=Bremerella cremea TaxID=1031537 RepID=A0A368KKG5_9BACT|nr:hypothetical protein [Bremerella cremea]RCS41261.1 hypothetical protein DTL42_22095 [Bremerella cremea]